MTDNDLLLAISNIVQSQIEPLNNNIQELKQDIQELKQDTQELKKDTEELKQRVSNIEDSVTDIKLILDNEIRVNIQRLSQFFYLGVKNKKN